MAAAEQRRGGEDKSQGRVYEMSSVGCKRMIRDATGCNAVRRGQSRCNQMSFKDVTWLVARLLPGLLLQGRGVGKNWEDMNMDVKQKCQLVMIKLFQNSQSLKFKPLWTKGSSLDNRQSGGRE